MDYDFQKELYIKKKEKTWKNEALFGFTQIAPFFSDLKKDSHILEVGSGSGLLLEMFRQDFSDFNYFGIEPFGKGFYALKSFEEKNQSSGITVIEDSYENCDFDGLFDIVYCVNVFEHLATWRHFLSWANKVTKPDGKIIILCPNYGFPLETHFLLPIVVNKALTYKIFRRAINKFEIENACIGLWESLNFVKKSEVIKFLKSDNIRNLRMVDDLSIIDDIILRLNYDGSFGDRQKVLGVCAKLAKKIGLIFFFKLIPNRLPYMKLVLKKQQKFN